MRKTLLQCSTLLAEDWIADMAAVATNDRDVPIVARGGSIVLSERCDRNGVFNRLARSVPYATRERDGTLHIPLRKSPHTAPSLAAALIPDMAAALPDAAVAALRAASAREFRNVSLSDALQEHNTATWLGDLPDVLARKLRGYQRAAIDYALNVADGRTFLAGDPGAGKTAVSLAIATIRGSWPAVVLCKPSLTGNWEDEIAKWLGPHVPVAVLSGQKNRPEQIPDGTRIVICSYSILHHRVDQLAGFAPQTVIADESQYLKTPAHGERWLTWHAAKQAAKDDPTIKPGKEPTYEKGSWRTWAARELARTPTVNTVLLLTATPAPNGRHVEYLPQLEVLGRDGEFGGADQFTARYCRWCARCWVDTGKAKRMPPIQACDHDTSPERKMGHRRVPNTQDTINTVELARRLRATTMTRHTQRQMDPQLPPIVPIELRLPLSKEGRKEYQKVETEFLDWLKTHAASKAAAEGISVGQAVARALRNAQGDHEQLVKVAHLRQAAARAKMDAVIEWLTDHAGQTDSGHPNKTVLFAWHRDVQKQLIDEVNRLLSRQPWADMLAAHYPHGYPGVPTILSATDTNAQQIREHKRRFQECPDEPFIVCSLAAAAEGHTLDAAWTVAMVQQGDQWAMQRQAAGRAYGRASNSHGITLVNLIADGTIELDIAEAIDIKKLAQLLTLDDGNDREFAEREIVEFESQTDAEAAFVDSMLARKQVR